MMNDIIAPAEAEY